MIESAEPKKIRILLADDHPLVLHGLARIIQGDKMDVVATANDGQEALAKILTYKPDLAILDLVMDKMSGLQVAKELKRKKLSSKVILLTAVLEDGYLEEALNSGVSGYVLKNNTTEELLNAIFHVMKGNTYVSPLIGSKLLSIRVKEYSDAGLLIESLSSMERKVLTLLARNKTSKEIGKELAISSKTVTNHRTNICGKLNLSGPNALLSFALQNRSLLK